MSTHQTSLPNSAKPAAVTRPTYPVPITAMGSRSEAMERPRVAAGRSALRAGGGQRPGDAEHLVVAQVEAERVRHPIDRLRGPPRDQTQLGAVEVQLETLAVHVADLGRRGEDRGVGPGRSLHPVVLAHVRVEREHDSI